DMSRIEGSTVIIVTHNAAIAPIADRVIYMHDAKVKEIQINQTPKEIADIEW
ncbi:MAG: ABC transporter ATP-binding protein, partial [Clostridia bacterium]